VRLLEVNGAQVFVEDTGLPPGSPDVESVVFGHGVLFSGRQFRAQIDRLRDRYRCVAVDFRGQGLSPASDSGYDMDTLTEDVVAIIDKLGLGAVHFVGLSMGGFVGMRLAARHPELVRSLVLLDTSSGPEPRANIPRYKLLAAVYMWIGIRPVRKPVEKIMFGPTYLRDPRSRAELDEWVEELSGLDKLGVKKAIYGVIEREPIHPEIGRITAPTLVAIGADDVATTREKSEAIVAGIPGSRLEVIADAGHSSSIEQPDAVADLIESFIEGQPSSA
jgi:pimeloyl-ACP methyl ester carboxylesterase